MIAHNIAIRLQLQFSQFTTTRRSLRENTTCHLSFCRPRCLSLTMTTTSFKESYISLCTIRHKHKYLNCEIFALRDPWSYYEFDIPHYLKIIEGNSL